MGSHSDNWDKQNKQPYTGDPAIDFDYYPKNVKNAIVKYFKTRYYCGHNGVEVDMKLKFKRTWIFRHETVIIHYVKCRDCSMEYGTSQRGLSL